MVFLFIGLAFGWLLYNAADEVLTNTGQHLRMVLPMIMRLLFSPCEGGSMTFTAKSWARKALERFSWVCESGSRI